MTKPPKQGGSEVVWSIAWSPSGEYVVYGAERGSVFRWNAEKKADPDLAWWAENSKCAYQESFWDLDRALRDFIRSKKGTRKGKRLGFPRSRT